MALGRVRRPGVAVLRWCQGWTVPGKPRRQGSASSAAARADPAEPADPADAPDDPESVARLICLRLLTAAPRTRAQLADALSRRGVPAEAAGAVLGRFTEVGLIDDATFATAWVESRHYGRGLGRRALVAELDRRGVERGHIEAAMDQLSPETERATALALVERRLAGTAGQPYPARVRRLTGMLARKGYPARLAFSVVREALDRAAGPDEVMAADDEEILGLELAAQDELTEDMAD